MTGSAQSSHSCEESFLVRCTTVTGHLIWTLAEGQLLCKLKWRYRPIVVIGTSAANACFAAVAATHRFIVRVPSASHSGHPLTDVRTDSGAGFRAAADTGSQDTLGNC